MRNEKYEICGLHLVPTLPDSPCPLRRETARRRRARHAAFIVVVKSYKTNDKTLILVLRSEMSMNIKIVQ